MKRGVFKWSVRKLANSLKIKEEDVKLYFKDGRRVSFILERRIAYEVLKGKLAPNEGSGWDVTDTEGGKWEVRSISKDGVYFCPSYMVGSGRKFELNGFLKKLKEVKGYILSDIESFPNVPFWIIPVEVVSVWWNEKKLGTTTKISREKALYLIDEMKLN